MRNANPIKPRQHKRLEDKIAAQAAGKSLRIVVHGTCRVCKRRSSDVPATKSQALRYFSERDTTTGFRKFETRMLETGVHRECQPVEDRMLKGEKRKVALANVAKKPKAEKPLGEAAQRAQVNAAALVRRQRAADRRKKAAAAA